MPFIASAGTYVPCWGVPECRVAGEDADAVTHAVAGQAAVAGPRLVLGRIAVNQGVPDYGYAFRTESEAA